MWKWGQRMPPSSGGHMVWQHMLRCRPLPQSQASSARTSSWKSGLPSVRLRAAHIFLCYPTVPGLLPFCTSFENAGILPP